MKHARIMALLAATISASLTVVPRGAVAVPARLTNDSYTSSSAVGGTYGSQTNLKLQSPPPMSAATRTAYILFDLNTLPTGTTAADVAKATLTLWPNTVTVPGNVDLYRVTSTWQEKTIHYSLPPTLAGAPEISGISIATTDKNQFRVLDVTATVVYWLSNPGTNFGLALVPITGTAINVKLDSDLKVAHCSNTACTSATLTTLDSIGSVGTYTSITIGTDGMGLISYYDATNLDLKVAHCGNTTCTTASVSTLDSTGDVGSHTAITIGTDGLPLISYYDVTNGNMKVLQCGSAFCVPYYRLR